MRRRTGAVLACVGVTLCPVSTAAQVFADGIGSSSKWIVAGDGDPGTVEDVRFGFDYGNFDIFGDGFITGSIPEAPRTPGRFVPTTGIFVSANNNSRVPTGLIAGIYADGLAVGVGTTTPDYVLRFDAFHSVTTGVDGQPPPAAVNFQWAGINAVAPSADGEIGSYNGPFDNSSLPPGTAGQALAITGEQGAFDDYELTVGGVTVEDRDEGFTGLATAHIARQFAFDGFTGGVTPISPSNADARHLTPIPGQEAIFDVLDPATGRQYWLDQFPPTTGPLHFDTSETENPNDFLDGGTPYNRWATHEVFFVEGIWTYVINGTPVLQVDPAVAGDGTQVSTGAGTVALGFLDPFESFNTMPEGSNFVVYDNIAVEAADPSDVPDMITFLRDNRYIVPDPAGLPMLAGLLLCVRSRGRR